MSERGPWLVSARWDVAVFGGSALLAFGLLLLGRLTGRPLACSCTWRSA